MPDYEREVSTEVDATPAECFAAMTDWDGMPGWQRALERCEVVSRHADGSAREVLYEVDARVRRVSYRLEHDYDPPHRIGSRYVGGDFKDMGGEWRFEAAGDGTRVRLRLRIDPGTWVPGPVRRLIEDAVMRRSIDDLKRRVEAG